MKKTCIFLLLIWYCFLTQASTTKSIETDINGTKFTIDKRIELFYTIAYLSDYPFLNGLEIEYKNKLEKYFEPYKKHETIERFRDMFSKVFNSIDAPIHYMLSMDEDLNFIVEPKYIKSYHDSDTFRLMLKSFATDSDFNRYYEDNMDLYRIILSTVEFNFTDFTTKKMLDDYYGIVDNKEFVIILNLLGSGNFGPLISTPKEITGYCVISSIATLGNIPAFPPSRELYGLSFHEFSHTYITPLIEKNENVINKYTSLLDPIKESMSSQAYDNWITVVNEHITRAVTCRLAAKKYGEESAYLTEYRLEIGKRFIYVDPLINKLKMYENNRDKYKSFEDFFPELLSVFSHITQEDIDSYQKLTEIYRKPQVNSIPEFNSAFQANQEDMVIIISTAEEDAKNQEELTDFVKAYKNHFPKAGLLTDEEALNSDLSDKNLVIFGTPWGNLFLKKYIHQIPILIERDKIVVGREYTGNNYQFLTSWVNPLNTDNSMAIFTAQKVEDIIWINTIMPGSGFTIAKNYKTIKTGEYINAREIWIVKD